MNKTIIGITGGSGSGKTYLSNKIINKFGDEKINIIKMDSYYKDLAHLSMQEREVNNFDHPDAFDFELLVDHLNILFNEDSVKIPIYDYKTHTRKKNTKEIKYKPIIIIEGIFSMYYKKLRELMDYKVFIATSNKTRKERRINRDKISRDRTLDSILNQYEKMVEPMYEKYIKPMKNISNLIIKENDKNNININKLFKFIELKL
mgnify:CR=1 FL=1